MAYKQPQQREKEENERLRVEREQIKFIDHDAQKNCEKLSGSCVRKIWYDRSCLTRGHATFYENWRDIKESVKLNNFMKRDLLSTCCKFNSNTI